MAVYPGEAPRTISRDTLMASLRALGLDPENVKTVRWEADTVTVEEFVQYDGGRILDRDPQGKHSLRKRLLTYKVEG